MNLLTSSITSSGCWARFTIFVRISEHPPKQEKEPAAIDQIGKSWCIQKSWLTQHCSTKLEERFTFTKYHLQKFLASGAYGCQLVRQNIFQICHWISHAWLNILIATTSSSYVKPLFVNLRYHPAQQPDHQPITNDEPSFTAISYGYSNDGSLIMMGRYVQSSSMISDLQLYQCWLARD